MREALMISAGVSAVFSLFSLVLFIWGLVVLIIGKIRVSKRSLVGKNARVAALYLCGQAPAASIVGLIIDGAIDLGGSGPAGALRENIVRGLIFLCFGIAGWVAASKHVKASEVRESDLSSKDKQSGSTMETAFVENTSGQGKAATVPVEVKKWNWGAFLLNWIWGLGNRTYIALLCLVPLLNVVMVFVLGAKGSEWAWRNKRWESVEHFRRVQKKWAWIGLAVILVAIVLRILVSR
jgi:hypothetical protein